MVAVMMTIGYDDSRTIGSIRWILNKTIKVVV